MLVSVFRIVVNGFYNSHSLYIQRLLTQLTNIVSNDLFVGGPCEATSCILQTWNLWKLLWGAAYLFCYSNL